MCLLHRVAGCQDIKGLLKYWKTVKKMSTIEGESTKRGFTVTFQRWLLVVLKMCNFGLFVYLYPNYTGSQLYAVPVSVFLQVPNECLHWQSCTMFTQRRAAKWTPVVTNLVVFNDRIRPMSWDLYIMPGVLRIEISSTVLHFASHTILQNGQGVLVLWPVTYHSLCHCCWRTHYTNLCKLQMHCIAFD